MPVPAVGPAAAPRPAPAGDGLREALLARVRLGAWDVQDADWEAEIAALEAAGECEVPPDDELGGLEPDPLAGPPDGEHAWLADLPGALLDEYLAATAEPARPEPIAAGWWNRATGDGTGFAAGGVADSLPPGPVLAGLAGDTCAAGLGRLTDDELVGVLRAGRRLQSWSAWLELSAAGELMSRRLAQQAAGQAGLAEHADAEVAAALRLTGRAADQLLDLAMTLRRLPLTGRALAAGAIDLPRARVIAEEVAGLSDEHLAGVEERVLTRAADQTTTRVRAATRRAVFAADPSAVRRRQERAEQEARVERWAEHAGTAALAGRDLPPTGALLADQHLTELARALHAAGLTGTMDQLRARVFLALLSGQPMTSLLSPTGQPVTSPLSPTGQPVTSPLSPTGQPVTSLLPPAAPDSSALGSADTPAVTGTINLTMPLSTWIGLSQSPGDVSGFGPLTADDCRHLGAVLGAHPRTRWCLTVTGQDGRPVAHGCARSGRGQRGPPGGGAGPPPADPGAWVAGISLEWLETGECTHRRESAGYRPPPSLQHLIRVRQQVCAYPGCGRPGAAVRP